MNVSLVLSCAAHIPERRAALELLKSKLKPSRWAAIHEETEQSPNWQWAAHAWDWAAEQNTLGTVFLQEDVDLAPDFESRVEAFVTTKPEDLIGIHCAHPGARRAYLDGYRWCATRDGLIGVAYYLPTDVLRDLVKWRLSALNSRAFERVSEDCLVDVYAMCHGRQILHPLPSPVRHKVDMKSTYDNDNHLLRMTQVTWEDEARLEMPPPNHLTSGVAWLGEFYAALPHHIPDLLKDKDEAKRLLRAALDCRQPDQKFRRFFGQVRGSS